MPYLCDLEGNVYFEIEKISIFLCQKIMRICVLLIVILTNVRKTCMLN